MGAFQAGGRSMLLWWSSCYFFKYWFWLTEDLIVVNVCSFTASSGARDLLLSLLYWWVPGQGWLAQRHKKLRGIARKLHLDLLGLRPWSSHQHILLSELFLSSPVLAWCPKLLNYKMCRKVNLKKKIRRGLGVCKPNASGDRVLYQKNQRGFGCSR